jgi:hypothetical protein
MSLLPFEESRPWARSITKREQARQMPPWHIEMTVGSTEFENNSSLWEAEIAAITKGVDAGAPQGDPKDVPRATS